MGVGLREQGANLFDPATALAVVQIHDFLVGPMKMEGYQGHLPANQFRKAASYSPIGGYSRSNSCWQWGQRRRWPPSVLLILS